jgi:PIN domain nuclease of toxin-antitoxin system
VILLDTHAAIWWHRGRPRSRRLDAHRGATHLSPATVLELQFLLEAGKLRLRKGSSLRDLIEDDRWPVDDPPAAGWFERARNEAWTRDPFDRLIVAHARLRGWRLATADEAILERLGAAGTLEI